MTRTDRRYELMVRSEGRQPDRLRKLQDRPLRLLDRHSAMFQAGAATATMKLIPAPFCVASPRGEP